MHPNPAIRFVAMALAAFVLASAWPARADFEQGVEAIKRRQFTEAMGHLLPEAKAGNAVAQLYVANMYRRGWGVTRDYAEAARWYHRAAEQGEVSGMYNYAVHLREGLGVERDQVKATEWFLKGAERGHPASMLNLGLRYFEGRGVERDPVRGYAWVQKAAGNGSVPAIRRRRDLEQELSPDEIRRGRALARELP